MAAPIMEIFKPKNTAGTLYFPLYAAGTDNVYTGAAPANTDVTYSLDGAAGANPAAAPVQIGATGLWTLAVIAGEMNGDFILYKIDNANVDPLIIYIDTVGGPLACLEGAEPTAATASNSTFRQILQKLKRRFYNKTTQTSTVQTHYKDDSTTSIETQACSDDGTTQSLGKSA